MLEQRGEEMGISDLHDPGKVVEGGIYQHAVYDVAQRYANIADVATTNTFGLRRLIHSGEDGLFREAINSHHKIVRQAMTGARRWLRELVSLGPVNDCYKPEDAPSTAEAKDFHGQQLSAVRGLHGVDGALIETLGTVREGLGAALAARETGIPAILSFVIGEDGNLLSGETLREAINEIDLSTGSSLLGYSVNCCPISGAEKALAAVGKKGSRVIAAYPNAIDCDPRKLESLNGIQGVQNPDSRALKLSQLVARYPSLEIIGGCCGFDHDSVGAISRHCARNFEAIWRSA